MASRLYAKFDCPVAPEFSLLATAARDCETGLTRKFAPLQVRKNRCMNSFTQIAKIQHSHVCISLPLSKYEANISLCEDFLIDLLLYLYVVKRSRTLKSVNKTDTGTREMSCGRSLRSIHFFWFLTTWVTVENSCKCVFVLISMLGRVKNSH